MYVCMDGWICIWKISKLWLICIVVWPQPTQHLIFFSIFKLKKKKEKAGRTGNSLVVQWLGFCTFNAEGPGSIPGQGIKIPTSCLKETKKVSSCWLLKKKSQGGGGVWPSRGLCFWESGTVYFLIPTTVSWVFPSLCSIVFPF